MPKRTPVMVVAVFLAFLLASEIVAAPISGLYVFGDSLSDPGNNAIAFGSTATPPFNVTQRGDITSNAFVPTYPLSLIHI